MNKTLQTNFTRKRTTIIFYYFHLNGKIKEIRGETVERTSTLIFVQMKRQNSSIGLIEILVKSREN